MPTPAECLEWIDTARRYVWSLGRHLSHEEREELHAEALRGLAEALVTYDPATNVPQGYWVRTKMWWATKEHVRRLARRRERGVPTSLDIVVGEEGQTIGDLLPAKREKVLERVAVQSAMMRLTRRERNIIFGTYWLGLSSSQIARRIACSTSTVQKTHRRALGKLHDYLE